MDKTDIMRQLKRDRVVAVIRGESESQVIKTADAVVAGGINFLEITFTIPNAHEIIKKLVGRYQDKKEVIVGAGTCLDSITARQAILSGAKFVVSPHFDKEIMEICNIYRVPIFPGATTVTGMIECLKHGADVIKLFPADTFGPSAIKSFKGPLPQVEIMPTGGCSADNVGEWLKQGAIAVGAGGDLTRGAATGDYEAVIKEAKRFVKAISDYAK